MPVSFRGQACNCTPIPLISPSKKKNKYEQALRKPEKVSRIPLEETTINHFKNGLMVPNRLIKMQFPRERGGYSHGTQINFTQMRSVSSIQIIYKAGPERREATSNFEGNLKRLFAVDI